MRFFKLSALIILCFNISSVANSQTPPNNQFYDNLLISEEYSVVSDEDIASQDAKAKLQAKRNKINIDDDIKLKQIIKNQRRENKQRASTHQHIKRISQLPSAPFGLLWGATYEETLSSGVILKRTEEKDYVNSFIASQLPKPLSSIRSVVVSFGEDNQLWRMIAYGALIKDTPDAEKVIKEYRRFYGLLDKKYGNAEEVFNPKIKQVTKIINIGNGKTKEETENVPDPIGNPEFLSQLQTGEADLYATFYNKEVGAVLSVNVDGNGDSYLILEYKNLKIFQQQQDKTIDAL